MEGNRRTDHWKRWNHVYGNRAVKRNRSISPCPVPRKRARDQPSIAHWNQSWCPPMVRPILEPIRAGHPYQHQLGLMSGLSRGTSLSSLSPVQKILSQAKMVCEMKSAGLMASGRDRDAIVTGRAQRFTIDVNGNEVALNGQSYPYLKSEDINRLVSKLNQVIDTNTPIELSPESLRVRRPSAVAALYGGKQCTNCSLRFDNKRSDQRIAYSKHLDWHFRQNRRAKDKTISKNKSMRRNWYYPLEEWLKFKEVADEEQDSSTWLQNGSDGTQNISTVCVQTDESLNGCPVCEERFDQKWNHSDEEWQLQNAVKHSDQRIYHPLCLKDFIAQTSLDFTAVGTDESNEFWNCESSHENPRQL